MKIDNSVSAEEFMKAENGKGRVSKLEPLSEQQLHAKADYGFSCHERGGG